MSRENDPPKSDGRRSFLKKGALVSGGLALGMSGFTVAQEDGTPTETPTNETQTETPSDAVTNGEKALMFNDEFRPGSQFRVKSPVLDYTPDVEGVEEGSIWSDYNTRLIEYLNTNEEVYFFPAHAAEVQQGTVYELHNEFSLFADDVADQGIMSVSFEPVAEEDILFPENDGQFEAGDDFGIVEGGGKALVHVGNFFPNALLRVTSDVEEWVPRPAVQGSDIFSEYNTRHAEYLNTDDEFPIYPAHAADVEQGNIYVIRDEFDISDPEGFLVTADLDRVNENDLDDDLL